MASFCAGAAFMTLFWQESLAAWRSMHFLGHFMVAAVLLGEPCSTRPAILFPDFRSWHGTCEIALTGVAA